MLTSARLYPARASTQLHDATGVPFVCEPAGDILGEASMGRLLRVDADAGTVEVLR